MSIRDAMLSVIKEAVEEHTTYPSRDVLGVMIRVKEECECHRCVRWRKLIAEVEATPDLCKDTARLNWMQAHPKIAMTSGPHGVQGTGRVYIVSGHEKWTLREILDRLIEEIP